MSIGLHAMEMPAPFVRKGLAGLGAEGDLAPVNVETPGTSPGPNAGEAYWNAYLEQLNKNPTAKFLSAVHTYVLRPLSFGVSVYHGYKRNDSLGWGLGWGVLGAMFPILTPTVALAQGLGKPKKK
jgi:hypothetical protein